MDIAQFVRARLFESPTEATTMVTIIALFRAETSSVLPRNKIIGQLKNAFIIATDSRGVAHLVGHAVRPPEPLKIEAGVIVRR